MKTVGKKIKLAVLLTAVFMSLARIPAGAEEPAEIINTEELMDSYLEELDMEDIQESISQILPDEKFSFRQAVLQLVKGEIPLDKEHISELAKEAVFGELRVQKTILVQILVLVILAAVFTNFIQIFRKNQISDIAFYIIYLLLFVLMMNAFRELSGAAGDTMGEILHFMKLLLPVYLVVASLAAGSVTAVGFYELTLAFIGGVQGVMIYAVLPGIGFYVLFLLLNHLAKEEYLSKLAELLKTVLSWTMKTLFAMVIGIQSIQGLLLPAIDSLKNTIWTKATGAVPVLGNTLSAVTETVLGTAVLLKNAVGVAGLLVIALICLAPIIRLAVCTLLYKAVAAIVQPVSDKRITQCISGVGEGIGLLLRAVSMTGVMFLLTLAMVTASIRGR